MTDFQKSIDDWLDGSASEESFADLNRRLAASDEDAKAFAEDARLHFMLREMLLSDKSIQRAVSLAFPGDMTATRTRWRMRNTLVLSAAMVLIATGIWWSISVMMTGHQQGVHPSLAATGNQAVPGVPAARLTQAANAELVRELLPELNSPLYIGHEYALLKGMIELTFANGATAIINAPAVFEVVSAERMELKIGDCSVHAPESAKGFEIVTPMSRVVDLGTRFSLSVNDTGHSEVQVIEGAAEVHSKDVPRTVTTLLKGEAVREAPDSNSVQPIEFSAKMYQPNLPDRVISYEAAPAALGPGVRDLMSVTVQRDGKSQTYPVDELIGIEVIHFESYSNCNSAASDQPLPQHVADLLENDRALNTGLINFNRDPHDALASPTVFEDFQKRSGLAVRFRSPVTNGPGPDVVLFEVQSVVYPSEGDHFCVSPLHSGDGLHTHLVQSFDLTMNSANARQVAPFQVTVVTPAVKSLDDFSTGASRRGGNVTLSFYALAVGIDLSDLGYKPGASVEGLFFEDDGSDSSILDPVFIAGLPGMPTATRPSGL